MSRDRIARILDLPPPGPSDQDWEFCVPEALRTADLVARAFDAYAHPDADDGDREVLFDVLVDVINEDLGNDVPGAEAAWERIVAIVKARPRERRARVGYWSLPGFDLEDVWPVTPRARVLYREVYGEDARSTHDDLTGAKGTTPRLPLFPVHSMHTYAIAQAAVAQQSQDVAAVFPTPHALVVALADGVSGSPGGREAAQLVIALARAFVERVARSDHELALVTSDALVILLEDIDHAVYADGPAGETTALVLVVGQTSLVGASVGDSRALSLAASGSDDLSADQPRKPRIGSGRARPTGFGRTTLGETIIAATDGLWECVTDAQVLALRRECAAPDELGRRLLDAARSPRGRYRDDVTVVVLGSC